MKRIILAISLIACVTTTCLPQSQEWNLLGTIDGTVQCLTADVSILFAGTYSQGVLRSIDGGASWTQIRASWNVTSMTIQQNSWGNRLYISNESGGFCNDFNGEKVWLLTGLVSEKTPAFVFFKDWIFIGDTDGVSRSNASESGQDDGWTREFSDSTIALASEGEKLFAMTKKEIRQREVEKSLWHKITSLKSKDDVFKAMTISNNPDILFVATSFGLIQYKDQKWSYFQTSTTERDIVALTIWTNPMATPKGAKHLIATMQNGLIYRSGPLQ